MIPTFKVLSLLLGYPTAELKEAVPEMGAALAADGLIDRTAHPGVYRLLDQLARRDLYDLQERYVLLFDRTRSLSLHLFEHVHGEGRDRGQAMVDLQTLYAAHGLEIQVRELPDYLPLFLEFLATQPLAEARALLAQPLHVLVALRERLVKRQSDYAAVLRALETLAGGEADADGLSSARAATDDDPNDLAALDAAWEEAAVTFGPADGRGTCSVAEDMVKRMAKRPGSPAPSAT